MGVDLVRVDLEVLNQFFTPATLMTVTVTVALNKCMSLML